MWVKTEEGIAVNLDHASHLTWRQEGEGIVVLAFLATRPFDSPTLIRRVPSEQAAKHLINDLTTSANHRPQS